MANIFDRLAPIAGCITFFKTPAQDLSLTYEIQCADACRGQKVVVVQVTSQ